MQQDVLRRLTETVRTFNARDRAAERGLHVAIADAAGGAARHGKAFHLGILRCMPLGADLPPEKQNEECAAEIALLRAAEEINRLVDEAHRQNVTIELRLATDVKTHDQQLELVLPALR